MKEVLYDLIEETDFILFPFWNLYFEEKDALELKYDRVSLIKDGFEVSPILDSLR